MKVRVYLESEAYGREYFGNLDASDFTACRRVAQECSRDDGITRRVGYEFDPTVNTMADEFVGHYWPNA